MDALGQYKLDKIDSYFNYTCQGWYEYLYSYHPSLTNNGNPFYKSFLINICQDANLLEYPTFKQIFTILIEYMQLAVNEINDHSYEGLTGIKSGKYCPKLLQLYLTYYVYALEILGSNIQR